MESKRSFCPQNKKFSQLLFFTFLANHLRLYDIISLIFWVFLGAKNFDIDGVWSLKDLSVPKTNTNNSKGRHGEVDSWNLNVGKNYYSRHGLLGGEHCPSGRIT